MAKPDPIPTFIEIDPKAAASVPTVQAQPVAIASPCTFTAARSLKNTERF